MKISELKQQIEEGKNYKDIIEFISYIPFVKKKIMCESIADSCIKEENGMIICDHCMKQLTTDIMLINNYTNLEFNEESYVEEYDYLCENDIVDYVVGKIKKSETYFIQDMVWEEIENRMRINNTIEGILNRGLNKLADIINNNLDPKKINKLIKTVAKELRSLDFDKLEGLKGIMDVLEGKNIKSNAKAGGVIGKDSK